MGKLGAHLRDLRRSLGITQHELAERAQISQARICQIERGHTTRPVPRRTLISLADALGVGIAALVGDDPTYDNVDLGLLTLDNGVASGLPPLAVPLIGRENDLSTIVDWLGRKEVRLVTLTGAGGVGKTHLALHAAQSSASCFNAITVVTLASCTDSAQIVSKVARGIGVRERDERPIQERLLSALASTRRLLVLDNIEQALPSAANLVAELLAACPPLTLLVTSRRPLRIGDEREYRVEPLALPDCTAGDRTAGWSSPAVELFIQRAMASSAQLTMCPETIASITEIVRRLDGLPLAIELAAARSKTFPPRAMLRHLDSRLTLLNRGPLDLPPRQRSLQATIAWSCDLLSEDQRALFRRLSVFAGGFTVEAVAAVAPFTGGCGEHEQSDAAVDDGLRDLAEHSLLIRTYAPDGSARFGMLETIREYARDQLVLAGEAAQFQARHLDWCLALAQRAKRKMFTSEDAPLLDQLELENANLQSALGWALDAGRSTHLEVGLLLAAALDDYWYVSGRLTEGRTWLTQAIAVSENQTPSSGRARCLAGASLIEQTQAAVTPAEIHGQEAFRLGQALDDWPTIGRAQLVLANLAMMREEFDRARRLHQEALACFLHLGDRPSIAITLINLGLDCHRQRDFKAARTYAEDALHIAREIGDRWDEIAAVRVLGDVARDCGHLAQAASYFVKSLDLGLSHGSERDVAHALSGMSTVAIELDDFVQGARCLGAAERIYRQLGIEIPPPLRPDWARLVDRLQCGLNPDQFAQAWNATSPPQGAREILSSDQAAG